MKPRPSNSNVSLIALLQSAINTGSQAAKNIFHKACYNRFAEKIWINSYSFSPYEADDIVADVFVKVFQVDLRRFPAKNELHLENYILKIATNHCIDQYKRRKGTYIQSLPSGDFSGPFSPCRKQEQVEVNMDKGRMFKSLTTEQRVALELWCQGYAYQEIADKLGLTLRAVKNRIYRARKHLKETFSASY